MKKLIVLLSIFAVTLSYGQGAGPGPNEDPGSGDGPGYGWEGAPDGLPDEIVDLRTQIMDLRAALKESRDALLAQLQEDGATDEEIRLALMDWRNEHVEDFEAIRELTVQVREYFRANRPNRPRAPISEEMLQRRDAFKANTQAVIQLRQQIRATDPADEELPALREQLQELLQERKLMLRNRRAEQAEGAGGVRRGNTGG